MVFVMKNKVQKPPHKTENLKCQCGQSLPSGGPEEKAGYDSGKRGDVVAMKAVDEALGVAEIGQVMEYKILRKGRKEERFRIENKEGFGETTIDGHIQMLLKDMKEFHEEIERVSWAPFDGSEHVGDYARLKDVLSYFVLGLP